MLIVLMTLMLQYPGLWCDGIHDDTAALQSLVANSTTITLPNNCKLLLSDQGSGYGVLIDNKIEFALTSDVEHATFGGPSSPRLSWNSNGGTMFKVTRSTGPAFRNLSMDLIAGKSIDKFIDFDGTGPATPTEAVVDNVSINGSNQSTNANFVGISISATSLSNHENYVISNTMVACPNAGTGILNGASANAKHQRFDHIAIGLCDIGLWIKNGSFDLSHYGWGFNDVDIRIDQVTETSRIDYLETEASQMGLDIRNTGAPTIIDNWRISNSQQATTGFANLDGTVIIRNPVLQDPINGVLFKNNGSGNLLLHTMNGNYSSSTPGSTTMAKMGFPAIAANANIVSTADRGISDSPAGHGGSFSLHGNAFQVEGARDAIQGTSFFDNAQNGSRAGVTGVYRSNPYGPVGVGGTGVGISGDIEVGAINPAVGAETIGVRSYFRGALGNHGGNGDYFGFKFVPPTNGTGTRDAYGMYLGTHPATGINGQRYGMYQAGQSDTNVFNGPVRQGGQTFANLGTPVNGTMLWCTDCAVVTPCIAGGSGAWAFRSGGQWKCPF